MSMRPRVREQTFIIFGLYWLNYWHILISKGTVLRLILFFMLLPQVDLKFIRCSTFHFSYVLFYIYSSKFVSIIAFIMKIGHMHVDGMSLICNICLND